MNLAVVLTEKVVQNNTPWRCVQIKTQKQQQQNKKCAILKNMPL